MATGIVEPMYEGLDPPVEGEEDSDWERTVAWRLLQLKRAGFGETNGGFAEAIARRPRIDLHQACEMLDQGCSPQLLIDILL